MTRLNLHLRHVTFPIGIVLLGGCAKTPPADTGTTAAGTTASTTGTAVQRLEAHVRAMEGTSADSTEAMLPEHEALVRATLTQMTDAMHARHVPADARWTATVDSVQQTAAQLPTMTRPQLAAAMPAHRERLMRLITLYRTLMQRGSQS